jgi:hypothetical protein
MSLLLALNANLDKAMGNHFNLLAKRALSTPESHVFVRL